MSPSTDRKRPIRIGGASGGFTDRVAAITRLARDPDVDAIVGDWLSEVSLGNRWQLGEGLTIARRM